MLAELPLDTPLPESCYMALEPELARVDLCRAFQGEYQDLINTLENMSISIQKSMDKKDISFNSLSVFYNPELTKQSLALNLVPACLPQNRTAIQQASELQNDLYPDVSKYAFLAPKCWRNLIGCYLTNLSSDSAYINEHISSAQQTHATVMFMHDMLQVRNQANPGTTFPHSNMQASSQRLSNWQINIEQDDQQQGLCASWHNSRQTRFLSLPWPASRVGKEPPHAPLSCEPKPKANYADNINENTESEATP